MPQRGIVLGPEGSSRPRDPRAARVFSDGEAHAPPPLALPRTNQCPANEEGRPALPRVALSYNFGWQLGENRQLRRVCLRPEGSRIIPVNRCAFHDEGMAHTGNGLDDIEIGTDHSSCEHGTFFEDAP